MADKMFSNRNMHGTMEVPDAVHKAVVNAFDQLEGNAAGRNSRSGMRSPRAMIAVAVCICLLGATATAAISSYRQRMQAMDAVQMESYYSIADKNEATIKNRDFTEAEQARYDALYIEYTQNGAAPETPLAVLDGQVYSGVGAALDAENRMLYLPSEDLNDEDILQIIDFECRMAYSIHQINVRGGWEAQMAQMDDADLDRIYLAMFSGNSEISGAYSRELTDSERARYAELTISYEAGLQMKSEAAILQTEKEYTGEGVAICVESSLFCLPEAEMTDEDLLTLIDFEHKARYVLDEIGSQIDLGLRAGYPQAGN